MAVLAGEARSLRPPRGGGSRGTCRTGCWPAQRGCDWSCERLPELRRRDPDTLVFHGSQPLVKEIGADFGTVRAAEPDRAAQLLVADHDAVGVAPCGSRPRRCRPPADLAPPLF